VILSPLSVVTLFIAGQLTCNRCPATAYINSGPALCGNLRRSRVNRGPTEAAAAAAAAAASTILSAERRCSLTFHFSTTLAFVNLTLSGN